MTQSNNTLSDADNVPEPFEGDLIGRDELAKRLEGYIRRSKIGATIAIDAEWGAGKTWFVSNWQEDLINKGYEVICLNAFMHDYVEDPLMLIGGEISSKLPQEYRVKFRQNLINVGKVVLPHLPWLMMNVMLTAIGAGFLGQTLKDTFDSVKNAISEDSKEQIESLGEKANEQYNEALEKKFEELEQEKATVNSFKKHLEEAVSKLDKPLVFIIDELDRCKPEFAVRLLERIKHFFDTPNVVFVLAVNKAQLQESIDHYYGFKTSNSYLDKFITTTVKLKPIKTPDTYKNTILKLAGDHGLTDLFSRHLDDYATLCQVFKPNLRQLIRIMNKISLNYDNGFRPDPILFLFLYLIGLETNKINTFDEKDFINQLNKLSEETFKKEYEIWLKQSFGDYQDHPKANITTYLYEVKYRSAMKQIYLIINGSEEAKNYKYLFSRHLTTTDFPKSDNLIEDWHDYINLI